MSKSKVSIKVKHTICKKMHTKRNKMSLYKALELCYSVTARKGESDLSHPGRSLFTPFSM